VWKVHYLDASSIKEAVSLLKEDKTEILAGGTDLLTELKANCSPNSAEKVVDIKKIPGLVYIKEDKDVVRIGSLTTIIDIENSAIINDKFPALAEAAAKVGSPQLRNRGTIAGNICQKVRCWFYRAPDNDFPCLRKDPDGICDAVAGDNRYNSIFSHMNRCFAVNPSDLAPALNVYSAEIVTDRQTINIDDFFTVNGEKTTVLADNEMIKEIRLPILKENATSNFIKFAVRDSFDFPVVNCAVLIEPEQEVIKRAKICLNAVYNIPYQPKEAEEYLIGKEKPLTEEIIQEVCELALKDAKPLKYNGYKVDLAKNILKRSLLACN